MKLEDCKPGVRVAVYGLMSREGIGTAMNSVMDRTQAIIDRSIDSTMIRVVVDGCWYLVHPKQLRKLKPKQKRQPREWTLHRCGGGLSTDWRATDAASLICTCPVSGVHERIKVREVLE